LGPQGTGRLARVWFWYAGRPADIPAPLFLRKNPDVVACPLCAGVAVRSGFLPAGGCLVSGCGLVVCVGCL